MSNFVIHIGPPKTATTSLQSFLQQVKAENFVYGGKFDNSTRSPIYHDIIIRKNKENIQCNIEEILSKDKMFFFV